MIQQDASAHAASLSNASLGFSTLAVHAGREPDATTGAIVPSLCLSTTFQQSAPAVHQGYEYSRSGNPTRGQFETAVAILEQAKYGELNKGPLATVHALATDLMDSLVS
jgi:cystathionine beta-lyase/cystathionine gamma-synthase